MVPAMAKAHTSTSRKLKADDGFAAAAAEALPTGKRPGPASQAPSLRDRLAEFFRAGQNGSDRELAALFGASVGSISVYRCQLKKLGIGVASPPLMRGAAKGERRPGGRKPGALAKRAAAGRGAKALGGSRGDSDAGRGGALSLGEIDQVLLQNIETELGLIVERYPDLARPVANVEQPVRLLLKLHR
jgi:hypothetical protein